LRRPEPAGTPFRTWSIGAPFLRISERFAAPGQTFNERSGPASENDGPGRRFVRERVQARRRVVCQTTFNTLR